MLFLLCCNSQERSNFWMLLVISTPRTEAGQRGLQQTPAETVMTERGLFCV